MKRSILGTFLIVMSILTASITVKSQDRVAEFLQSNIDDAKTLGHAYLEPFGKMFGTSLNGGWYQAARPHRKLGFNVTFITSIAMVPSNEKTFDVSKLNLTYFELKDPQSNLAPTIAGDRSLGPVLVDKLTGDLEFNLPRGANMIFTPVTFAQVGVGLPLNTELTVRFLPPVNFPKLGRISSWGFGVKNEFKEFIPGLKYVPIDLSVMFGYTKFTSEFDVNFKPSTADLDPSIPMSRFNNQRLGLDASGFTTRLLVGKTIPFLSVYAGLGYSRAVTEFGLMGSYAVGLEKPYGEDDIIEDPLKYEFPVSNFSANAGLRLRLGVIAFNFDYTLGDYSLYSAGVGISFR